MTALVIHGHFYQPTRENPWTGEIEREPSAEPFHDWNERIHSECYRPNAFVQIKGSGAERIVNNYAKINFNFGPTLLSWLKRQHPDTYTRVVEADRESVRQRNGHGNAIAQAYNHTILPLCNERDRRTQIRWGIADFRHRFAREPEALWLPETACNTDVLGLLIDEGLRFVILAPHQAARIREAGRPDWREAADYQIDTSVAYRYSRREGSGGSIAVFFYDGTISRAIAFEGALASATGLVDLFERRARGTGHLVNVATDGETYGHHSRFGDIALAYVLEVESPARGFWITNYGEYLDHYPPISEVEISNGPEGEGTSWSCPHGVGRWIRDCGCYTGGEAGWNQAWRGPLRRALDFLRDEAARYFEATRGDLFIDPWAARGDYIELIIDRDRSPDLFLNNHAPRSLRPEDKRRALGFLELQRSAMLMYASCGWFFNDISGIETLQILKYARRAIEWMEQWGLPPVQDHFLEILAQARSNRAELGNGADIYRKFVEPLMIKRE